MEALKFNLSGKTAFFKKPDVNTYLYFTYGHIHKVALLGLIGAVLGFGGYNSQENEIYPEFYEKLSNLKVAIVPQNDRGYIPKKVQLFNNSVGYASQEAGGNLIIKEQWLENPKWDIYILLEEQNYGTVIKERFLNSSFVYIPYLGKNDHFANIAKVEIVDITEVKEISYIKSLFLKKNFSFSLDEELDFAADDFEYEEKWKYEERLPVALEESTNQYITESLIFTNMKIELKESSKIYSCEGKGLVFL